MFRSCDHAFRTHLHSLAVRAHRQPLSLGSRECVNARPRTLARRSTELPVDDLSTLIGGWRTFLGGQVVAE
jgi:hypothetical protein